jgi:hypothetical protein
MLGGERTDPSRRAWRDGEVDPGSGTGAGGASFPASDPGSALRTAGLVAALIGIFAGMSWFLEATLRLPALGAPARLAAIGAAADGGVAPADAAIGPPAEQAAPGPGVCSMCYPAPERLARILKLGRRTAPAPPEGAATIDLRLRHELPFGRLIVALDDRTILSTPFAAPGGAPATIVHRLSVPGGRHAVRIEILDAAGERRAGGTIAARLEPDRIARIEAEHSAAEPRDIRLKLSTDDEAGTRASH